MGRLLLVRLPLPATGGGVIYCCKHCNTHLAYATDIISRTFLCKQGKAYLMDKMVNVSVAEKADDRDMTTGMHTVRDIFCVACGCLLGWNYLRAFKKDQRYKEGKFVMDRGNVVVVTAPSSSASAASSSVLLHHHHQQHSGGGDDDDNSSDDED